VIVSDSSPFAALLEEAAEPIVQVRVGMPPLTSEAAVSARVPDDLPDLSKLLRVWMLIGRGGTGKTTLALWLADTATARGKASHTLLAALDPTNRTLVEFFPATGTPRSANSDDTFAYLRELLQRSPEHHLHGIWDFGGGDLSLTRLLSVARDIDKTMLLHETALVPVYMLTPDPDDLATLTTHREMGFRPKTTLLVLNVGRAATWGAFAGLRAQVAYKEARADGAVEIIMPRLDDVVARRLRAFRGHFQAAASEEDGLLGGVDAMLLRTWVDQMKHAFAPVETWMPWG
jgi:hypothetical protein